MAEGVERRRDRSCGTASELAGPARLSAAGAGTRSTTTAAKTAAAEKGRRRRLGIQWHGFTQDACNAHAKSLWRLVAIERHGKVQMARAMLFKMNERVRINHRIGADLQGEVVAAEFALVADAAADPPNGGMEEEECFDDGLQRCSRRSRRGARGPVHARERLRISSGVSMVSEDTGNSTMARTAPTVTGPVIALETRSKMVLRSPSALAIRRNAIWTLSGA